MLVTTAVDTHHRIPRINSRQQGLPLRLPLPQPKQPLYTISYLTQTQPLSNACPTHPPPPPASTTMLRLPMPPPPPTCTPTLSSPPLTQTPPIDLYRKRKLAQRAQLTPTLTTATPTTSSTHPPTTPTKRLKPLPLPPASPPRAKPNSNPVSSPTHRLAQRQKQLDMGYTTAAYALYVRCVKLHERDEKRRECGHPVTPRKESSCSKRSWDGQVRKWRRHLHEWDEGGRMHQEYVGKAGGTGVAVEEMAETNDAVRSVEQAIDMEGNGSNIAVAGQDEDEGVSDGDEDEEDWRESIVRMAGALPD